VNIDGAARGSPSPTACAGIFRGSRGEYISGFSTFLGNQNVLYAKVMWAIFSIEHAQRTGSQSFGWRVILLCSVKFFLMRKWFLRLLEEGGEDVCNYVFAWISKFLIFREGNNFVDKLANLGVDNKLDMFWYFVIPRCLSLDFFP